MKAILKTIKPINNIDYKETFNSERNIRIRGTLIPELQKSMKLHYCPLVSQLTNGLIAFTSHIIRVNHYLEKVTPK